jgi:hypothetical protein
MKWPRTPPTIGATRRVRRFALFPVQTDDNYVVWLEMYTVYQEFQQTKNLDAWCLISRRSSNEQAA